MKISTRFSIDYLDSEGVDTTTPEIFDSFSEAVAFFVVREVLLSIMADDDCEEIKEAQQ